MKDYDTIIKWIGLRLNHLVKYPYLYTTRTDTNPTRYPELTPLYKPTALSPFVFEPYLYKLHRQPLTLISITLSVESHNNNKKFLALCPVCLTWVFLSHNTHWVWENLIISWFFLFLSLGNQMISEFDYGSRYRGEISVPGIFLSYKT